MAHNYKVGDKVTYVTPHKKEIGIVKEIPIFTKYSVRVVYNCNNDWDNYQDYTSALTNIIDLVPGWDTNPQDSFIESSTK